MKLPISYSDGIIHLDSDAKLSPKELITCFNGYILHVYILHNRFFQKSQVRSNLPSLVPFLFVGRKCVEETNSLLEHKLMESD